MMKIGTRSSPDWLARPGDLAFLKQIGVDGVDITMDICPGYKLGSDTGDGGRSETMGDISHLQDGALDDIA